MSKIHLDRLKQRYGWTGGKYEALMAKIIEENHRSVANAVARMKVGRLKAAVKRLGPKWQTLTLPSLQEVLPKRSVFIRKGAERGKLLTDDLRTQLAGDLRGILSDFTTKTGLPSFVRRQGAEKGQINEKLVNAFRSRIRDTFEGYTKTDPEIGVPTNIDAIAITETRSTINDIKNSYFTRLQEKNPDLEMVKRWVHHPSLSKEPRPGHADMDGEEVPMDKAFQVPEYRRTKEGWEQTGASIAMMHPHAPEAGPQDVINCHCDVSYVARRKAQ